MRSYSSGAGTRMNSRARFVKMGSIVLKSLSVLLGIFFVFVGTMKLTSHINKDCEHGNPHRVRN